MVNLIRPDKHLFTTKTLIMKNHLKSRYRDIRAICVLLILALVLYFPFRAANIDKYPLPTRTITGKVIDENKEPLILASVKAQGANIYTKTDIDGKFKIVIPDSCKALEFHYTGYASQIVTLGKADTLLVIMKTGIILDEVKVTEYKVRLIEQDNTTQGIFMSTSQVAGYHVDGSRVKRDEGISFEKNFNTEDYDLINENIFLSPQDAPLSTFSIDVDAAAYANMRRFLTSGQKPPKDAIRIEEMVNYFDYEYPQPDGDAPFSISSEVGICPWNPAHKLVHIGLQGKEFPTEELPASNLVFLIDVSGSMQVMNKLPLVISSFKILTEHLRQKDRVAIVVYAGSSGLVLPSTPGSNKADIIEALERLKAGGSTAGAEGIRQAYEVARQNFIKGGNNRVILATDGDFNVGVSSDSELVEIIEKERESGIFLTVLGYGMGNYKDNKMQKLADHGNGNHGYVDNLSEARKVFVNEFGGTLFTIAKDVKIQVEFNPSIVAGYRLIGYENRLLKNEDFNDDKKDAGEIGSGHSVTALYEIIPVGAQSAALKSVDELKYQKSKTVKTGVHSIELMTIKFRYKAPDGDISKLIEKVIANDAVPLNLTSENFRWSASVALFGMLLRESEFAGKSTYQDVEALASGSLGRDEFGYRKEFLEMVRGMGLITEAEAKR